MKVAIVGTSNLTKEEEKTVREICNHILKTAREVSDEEITLISGGADGVDSVAVETATKLGHGSIEIMPTERSWRSYKKRNMQIAKQCEELYCITTPVKHKKCYHHTPEQDHEKTAGCWTMNHAIMLGKPCKLLITTLKLSQ